jgi:hypothetical protein
MAIGYMLKSPELAEYKRIIEDSLIAIRCYGVVVGDVAKNGDRTLAVTFSRWRRTKTVEVPLDDLQGKETARAAINRTVHNLSKAIEKETMETRIKSVRCCVK